MALATQLILPNAKCHAAAEPAEGSHDSSGEWDGLWDECSASVSSSSARGRSSTLGGAMTERRTGAMHALTAAETDDRGCAGEARRGEERIGEVMQ